MAKIIAHPGFRKKAESISFEQEVGPKKKAPVKKKKAPAKKKK